MLSNWFYVLAEGASTHTQGRDKAEAMAADSLWWGFLGNQNMTSTPQPPAPRRLEKLEIGNGLNIGEQES